MTAPPPAATVSVPLVDADAWCRARRCPRRTTDTPAIGSAVSSSTVCAPGTVFTGGSFTALTVIGTVSVSLNAPSEVVTVSVSAPLKSGSPR